MMSMKGLGLHSLFQGPPSVRHSCWNRVCAGVKGAQDLLLKDAGHTHTDRSGRMLSWVEGGQGRKPTCIQVREHIPMAYELLQLQEMSTPQTYPQVPPPLEK